jgi:hypothetical protein
MIARYELVWFLLALVAIANGALREATYANYLDELSAHQVSTAIGALFSGLLVYSVSRVWPFRSAAQAWGIGALWLVQTVLFEFLFGYYVAGHSWSLLLSDYNLIQGRLWGLFLLWVLTMPYLVFRLARSKAGR